MKYLKQYTYDLSCNYSLIHIRSLLTGGTDPLASMTDQSTPRDLPDSQSFLQQCNTVLYVL